MKRFGGDRIRGLMQMAGMDEDTPIENRLVNRAIEGAQVRVEGFHFDIRSISSNSTTSSTSTGS